MEFISFWFGIFSASVAILASLSNRSLRFFPRATRIALRPGQSSGSRSGYPQ